MFTKKQEKTYLENGGTKCPKCGSENIEGASWNADGGGTASQEVSCLDCDAEWFDVYNLVGIQERG